MISKRITIVLGTMIIAIFAYIVYTDAVRTQRNLHKQKEEVKTLNIKYEQLNEELDQTIEVKQQSQEEVEKLQQEKQNLEIERQRLEGELQARARVKARAIAEAESKQKLAQASSRVINAATGTQIASAASGGARSGCGDNQYAAYIYGQESGGRVTGQCNSNARNPQGCYGIGQSCPASKIGHCGSDYSCQNAWFSQYAIQRYSSWANAYSFHKANGWW